MFSHNGSYLYPILAFHISLLIGVLSYAMRNIERNQWAGLRTPLTLSDPVAWRAAHAEVARLMPAISGVCSLLAFTALWLPAWRTPFFAFGIVCIQFAALLTMVIRWWRPS